MIGDAPATGPNPVIMTCHARWIPAGAPTAVDRAFLAEQFNIWWHTGLQGEQALRASVSSDASLRRVTVQTIDPLPPSTPSEAINTLQPGTQASQMAPPQVAVCMTLRTALAGRRFRGRMYLFGIPKNDIDQFGIIAPTRRTAIADSADGMRRGILAVGVNVWELVVWSRVARTSQAVTIVQVGDKVDIQRRRKMPESSYQSGA